MHQLCQTCAELLFFLSHRKKKYKVILMDIIGIFNQSHSDAWSFSLQSRDIQLAFHCILLLPMIIVALLLLLCHKLTSCVPVCYLGILL